MKQGTLLLYLGTGADKFDRARITHFVCDDNMYPLNPDAANGRHKDIEYFQEIPLTRPGDDEEALEWDGVSWGFSCSGDRIREEFAIPQLPSPKDLFLTPPKPPKPPKPKAVEDLVAELTAMEKRVKELEKQTS